MHVGTVPVVKFLEISQARPLFWTDNMAQLLIKELKFRQCGSLNSQIKC